MSDPSRAGGRKKPVARRGPASKPSPDAKGSRAASKPVSARAAPKKAAPTAAAGKSAAPNALGPRTGVRHWLLKTDPDSFPFDALWAAPRRTTGWSGVRNHLARNYLRDAMRTGDLVLLYHSSCDPAGVVGVGRIASAARPDPTQFDARDEHYDAKSRREAPTWWEVDVEALVRCPRFVTLGELRADPRLAGLLVLQKGQRLSVQPVDPRDFARVLELARVRPEDLPC